MASKSKQQQKLMGMAYAYKNDKLDISNIDKDLVNKIKSIADSMTTKELKDFAETKHTNLPEVTNESKYILSFENFLNKNN